MAARALTAAGRRVAGRTGTTPLLASRRNGVSMNHSSASARREEEPYKDVRAAAAAMTGAQVEAALNRKNVEVLQGEEHVATVLPDETIGGALDGGEDAAWVPDQDTGVFGPAHVDTHGGGSAAAPPHLFGGATEGSAASSADQDTGAFVPADADADAYTDTHGGGARPAPPHLYGGVGGTASVLDQAVFVREEDIEDVEKPAAIDMGNANADVNGSIKNY
ncbi:hypothetical protein VPH35_134310 [Triticum aestivum]|uniref:Uncharacterized protein n=1 Tax=Triticum aestivum TaxID=4565 RepID=A0A3B6TC15_WHEAT|nr:uncharacterized protein LOC123166376 [Triticum aestivum]